MEKNSKKIIVILIGLLSIICLLCSCCVFGIYQLSNNITGARYEDSAKRNASEILYYMQNDKLDLFVNNLSGKKYEFHYGSWDNRLPYNNKMVDYNDSNQELVDLLENVGNLLNIDNLESYTIVDMDYGFVSETTPTESVVYLLKYKDNSTINLYITFENNPDNYNVGFSWINLK